MDSLVSVIIPTFNRGNLVGAAIQSVLNQTYKNYEIIVVDDGSTDDTRHIISQFSEKVIYIYQPNHGRSNARNHGISLAKGKYIAFLDSDDLFLPTKLEKQVALTDSAGAKWSHTSYYRVKGELSQLVDSGSITGDVYSRIIKRCLIALPTVMVRKDALSGKGFNESLSVAEDTVLWIELAREFHLVGINEPLTTVRNSNESPKRKTQAYLNIADYSVRRDKDLSWVSRLVYQFILYSYIPLTYIILFIRGILRK